MDKMKKKKWKTASWTIGQNADVSANKEPQNKKVSHVRGTLKPSSKTSDSQNRGFVNPYNFVRVARSKTKEERGPLAHTHERFHRDCLTGRIECGLRLLTPSFIPDPEETIEAQGDSPKEMRFNRVNGAPCLPATSIKGMVRSILETVSNSCFSVLDASRLSYRDGRDRNKYNNSPADLLPDFLRPCSDLDSLCPACRIFGMVGPNSQALGGKVSFSTGVLVSERPRFLNGVLLKILGSPQPTSTNFYLIGDDYENSSAVTVASGGYDRADTILRGRKFYWLQGGNYTTTEPSKLNSRVELLLSRPEVRFLFSVNFENLLKEELELLVLSLELEPGMFHRLGMGKPLGLGAVDISILDDSFQIDSDGIKRYYQDIGCNRGDIMTRLDVKGLTETALRRYGDSINYSDLKSILSFDEDIAELVRYPGDFHWFTDHENEQLYTIEETKQGQRQTE